MIKKMELIKLYLIRKGIYIEFCNNLKNNNNRFYGKIENIDEFLEKLIKDCSINRLIDRAFIWSDTPQGSNYWSKHNANFIKYYKNIENYV